MKLWLSALMLSCSTLVSAQKSVHEFTVDDIDGDSISLSKYKGQKIMIVNTASKCGLTPQYKKLQSLYDTYKDSGLVIIGFPANDFMSQEPGSNGDIAEFCQKNYGVTFPMMSKVTVKGKDIHPLFDFLTDKKKNGVSNESVSWNFQKFLVNEEGQLEEVFSPKTQPDSEEIIKWIIRK